MALAVTGCLTEGEGGPEPAVIVKVDSTDERSFPGGSRVSLRLHVRSSGGAGVPRVGVSWTLTSEPGAGGALSDTLTVTDGTGAAQVRYTLGPTEGTSLIRAELADDPSKAVVFTVTMARTATLTSVTPASFRAGDRVILSGSGITASTVFAIGGVDVSPVSVSVTGTGATVLVPPCLTPGTISIRARTGEGVSEPVFADYSSGAGAIDLAVGEYLSLSQSALLGCATFAAAGPSGAEFLIVPQSTTGIAGESATYRLTGSVSPVPADSPPEGEPRSSTHAARFDSHLRGLEGEIAQLPRPFAGAPTPQAAARTVEVGERRNFQVCGTVTCDVAGFKTVRAEVKYAGTHAVIYQDLDAPPKGLNAAQFDELGAVFDDELYDVATRAFGAESDVDNDGRVAILLSPVVNSLTPRDRCSISFIAGFFFAVDISPGSAGDPRTNRSEVFFAIVPDPDGEVTCSFTVNRILQQVPVTFIHEFQHMISFHQRAMLRNGMVEELWLNEAMSHLAEELGGLHFRDLGDTTRFNQFTSGNLTNAYRFLQDPGATFVLAPSGSGTLEERGAGWLFLRWLVDQFGDDFPRFLAETAARGAENIERATSTPISRLLAQWFLATWVSDLPGSVLSDSLKPARLRYTSWDLRTTFGGFNEDRPDQFPDPFPIIPDQLTPPFFDRSGVLRAGSGDYYRLVQPANDQGFTVVFTDASGATIVTAVPRFNVVRIR